MPVRIAHGTEVLGSDGGKGAQLITAKTDDITVRTIEALEATVMPAVLWLLAA